MNFIEIKCLCVPLHKKKKKSADFICRGAAKSSKGLGPQQDLIWFCVQLCLFFSLLLIFFKVPSGFVPVTCLNH